MNQCIICRKEKDTFSDEHVIPESLGGYYHIDTVCITCNSDLGSFVDSKLVNHQFAEFQRYILGLKGGSKKLPNPFSGNHQMAENENQKIQLRLGKDGKPTPYIVPSVSYEKLSGENGGTKISINLDATDENKLDSILAKISKKFQLPLEQFDGIDRSVQSVERPNIKCTLSIDLAEFKIGLLKIAYEFAVDTVPEYFSDKSAIEISKILKNADYGSAESYINLGDGFDHTIFDSMCDYLDLESKKHYLVLSGSDRYGLQCLIHLHGMFSIGVKLSTDDYPNVTVFGVNDIGRKTFRKIYPEDIISEIYAPPKLLFQHYFQTEQSLQEFLALQEREDFDFYRFNDIYPIFDRMGNQLELNLYDKMKEVESLVTTEALKNGGIAHTFRLQGDVYIKILPSQKLVQIIAVREERRQIAKL